MPKSLSLETITIIKSTAPALRQHGLAITTRMYERLFVDPDIKAMFDQAAQKSGEQPKRLAAAILAFAENADNLNALVPAVERMAARHVATNVKPEHYPAVATALPLEEAASKSAIPTGAGGDPAIGCGATTA